MTKTCCVEKNAIYKNFVLPTKKPLLLVGQGVRLGNALGEFRKYLKYSNIPVLTSRLGTDLIEYDHPLYIGHPGNYGTPAAWKALKECYFLIVIGSRLSSAVLTYTPEKFAPNARIVYFDIDEEEIIKPIPNLFWKMRIDVKQAFKFMTDSCLISDKEWVERCQSFKSEEKMITKEMEESNPIDSYFFIKKLSDISSAKDIIMVDTGSCFHIASQIWRIKKGQRFLTTGGLSSMGWWAAAIGGAVLGRTIMITGDGSLQMNIQELATMKYYNLPIKLFVLNNDGYGLIRQTQRRFFEGRYIGESPDNGIGFPDLRKIAIAYDLSYYKISTPENCMSLGHILRNDEPSIIEVRIPKWQNLIREDETNQKDSPNNH